jgi:RES domain-containing protein
VSVRTYRIVKSKYAATAFDGEGARRFGGRWNSPGVAMVYTSATLSLAVLEILVQLQTEAVLSAYVVYTVEISNQQIEILDRSRLSPRWRSFPAPAELRALGDDWTRRATSVALRVPSAVLGTEDNYLLNPLHPAFARLKITGPEPLDVDTRLFRS